MAMITFKLRDRVRKEGDHYVFYYHFGNVWDEW